MASEAGSLSTAAALAQKLGARLVGAQNVAVSSADTLDRAGPTALSFVRDERSVAAWRKSTCGVALVPEAVATSIGADDPALRDRALIVVKDADLAMIAVLDALAPKVRRTSGIHASATIDSSATLGADVSIGPGVVVGVSVVIEAGVTLMANAFVGDHVRIGARCVIHPGVVIRDHCAIGSDSIVHAGVVIGADGFGYRPAPGGRGLIKVPHIGAVEIGAHVEIGANTTIDRGKFGPTLIGDGSKIDNLVQIGHNCIIGRCCVICGQSALAGSVTLGDGVTIGGAVGIGDNLTLGAGCTVAGRAGVMDNIPPGETWWGYPARPIRHVMRAVAMMDRLEEWGPVVKKLAKKSKQAPSA